MPAAADGEGLEGLDDALGDVISRKTHAQKRALEKQDALLTTLREEVDRLKKHVENAVERELYAREFAQLKSDAENIANSEKLHTSQSFFCVCFTREIGVELDNNFN